MRCRPGLNGLAQLGLACRALLICGQAVVRAQRRAAHGVGQGDKQLAVEHRHRKVAVLRLEHTKGRRQRVAVAHAARRFAGKHKARHRGGQKGQRGVKHGHVHVLALAGARGLVERGQRRPRRIQAGHHVRDRLAHQRGRAVGVAGGFHDAAHGLDDHVIGRALGHGAGLAKARHAHIDQLGVECAQRISANTQALCHAGAKVFHHHVHLLRQRVDQRHRRGQLQVKHQAFLVAVHGGEQRALALAHGANGAVVVALGRLHLDHLGAQIGQQHRGHGPGQHAGEVQHTQTVQGTNTGGLGHGKPL